MKRVLLVLTVFLATLFQGVGAGVILIHEPDFWIVEPPIWPRPPIMPPRPMPPPRPVWAPLEIAFVQATVKVKDQVAVTLIEQEFYNPNARQLEGTFLFPVPKGAHLDKFTMVVNGKQTEAELMSTDKARKIYEDIVRKLRDPALLEYDGQDLFKVRIFPIEPNSKKRITLKYTQVLKPDAGLVTYVFPMSTEKYSARPLNTVSVKVDLETKRPLKSIYSPSHKVEIKRNGENRATVGFEATNVKPDTDFQLVFAQDAGDLGVNLMTYKTGAEDGFFLLLATPAVESAKNTVIPKDIVFVLDTSGSMAGNKLNQAKKALAFCVENLQDQDRFEILRFSTEVEPLFNQLTEARPEARKQAQTFIASLKPIGGTAIDDALQKAFATRPAIGNRPYIIIFLTDGRPTIGVTEEDLILKNLDKNNHGNSRIFCFGIGTDVNTHLLDKITEATKAFSQYVLPEEDLEVKLSSFYTRIKEPALANTKLTVTSDIRITKLYPAPLPDLFKGDQLLVVGRYTGNGHSAAIIEGDVNGEPRKYTFDVQFAADTAEHDFIPRLWATRRVGYLLDEIRLHGENQELKEEITELARKYGIVTPYTAYLIVEDEQRRDVAQSARSLPAIEQNQQALAEGGRVYDSFRREREGDRAVAGARSYNMLKSALSAADGIRGGGAEVMRAAPMASAPRPSGGGQGAMVTETVTYETAARDYAQQARYLQGHTFYQNGEIWMDAEIQKLQHAARVKLTFGSPEYFTLLRQHPQVKDWLALGSRVHFVLAGKVYEVEE
ncbi:MAG: VIT domain-containing protein [Verrucomicrobiota bacterium]